MRGPADGRSCASPSIQYAVNLKEEGLAEQKRRARVSATSGPDGGQGTSIPGPHSTVSLVPCAFQELEALHRLTRPASEEVALQSVPDAIMELSKVREAKERALLSSRWPREEARGGRLAVS